MNGDSPKISFIPKSTLAEEGMFITRHRPRSVLGFLAASLFLASMGVYIGFYFYHDFLSRKIQEKTGEINKAQHALNSSTGISKAKIFNARADLARGLLDKHIVASPIFDFLSQNTLESILYTDFNFKDEEGLVTLSLKGEAPHYSSLAYQSDVFRARKELIGFSVENIELTKAGSVSFVFSMAFNRAFLSYERYASMREITPTTTSSSPANTIATTTTPAVSANTSDKKKQQAPLTP